MGSMVPAPGSGARLGVAAAGVDGKGPRGTGFHLTIVSASTNLFVAEMWQSPPPEPIRRCIHCPATAETGRISAVSGQDRRKTAVIVDDPLPIIGRDRALFRQGRQLSRVPKKSLNSCEN
jgi:hypothetical protein